MPNKKKTSTTIIVRPAGGGQGRAKTRPAKQPSRAPRAPAARKSSPASGPHGNAMIAAMTGHGSEPFRLPDSCLEESVPMVLTNEYMVTSDAAGYAVFGEYCNLAASSLAWTVTAGSTGAFAGTAHPDITTFAAAFPLARMVMYRVHVEYVGAEQTAAGRIYVINSNESTTLSSVSLATIYDDANYTGKALDGYYDTVMSNQNPRYEGPSSTAFMVGTFQTRMMFAAGLPPSTQVFRVRVERFMEGLPSRSSLHRGSAQIEPYNAALMEVATNASHPSLHGGAYTAKPQIMDNVWKAVKAAGAYAWDNRAAISHLAGSFSTSGMAKNALLALTL